MQDFSGGTVHHRSMSSQPTRLNDDPIIYFTLIDFLVQLLFFGLFIFVVIEYGNSADGRIRASVDSNEWAIFQKLKINLPFFQGMAELVPADTQQAMLDALKKLEDENLLDEFLDFVVNFEDPLPLFQLCAADMKLCASLIKQCKGHPNECRRFAEADQSGIGRMMRGLGTPPCREDKKSLFSISASGSGLPGEDGSFQVLNVSPAGKEVLSQFGIQLFPGQLFSKDLAKVAFSKFTIAASVCHHYIDYIADTDSESMRHIMEGPFYLRIKRPLTGP